MGSITTVCPKDGFETSFIKPGIMCNKGKTFYVRSYLFPDIWKYRRFLSIAFGQTMNFLAKPLIVFWLRMNQGIEPLKKFSSTYNGDSDAK